MTSGPEIAPETKLPQSREPLLYSEYTVSEPLRPYIEEQALARPIETSATLGAIVFILLFLGFTLHAWSNPLHDLVATQRNVFLEGEWWRLLTSPFVHADLIHLLANSMLFLVFATLLNNYFGRWAFPVLSILGAAATEGFALLTYPIDVKLVGASGMVYLMAGMWLVYFARHSSYLPISHRIMRILAFVLIVLLPTSIEPQVSYRSHAIGFGLGLFMAWLSLPWMKPKPLGAEAYAKAKAIAARRRRFLEEEDDVLTYLALRDQPRRQSPLGDPEQLTNPNPPEPEDLTPGVISHRFDNK